MIRWVALLSLLLSFPLQAKKLISTVVGRVQDHYVTSREVQMNDLLEQALAKKEISAPPKLKSAAFQRHLSNVLMEWVVFYEARQFGSADVSGENLRSAHRKIRNDLVGNPHWQNLKVTEAEQSALLNRKLRAKNFIRFRAKSSKVPITDDEAHRYYENNSDKFGGLPFENFKETIKEYLSRKQVDQRLKNWFEVLQSKYNVQSLLSSPQN